jgi:pre-mRNA-splicing helicase BRR2
MLSAAQAMMRPCYSAILNHAAGGKPAIVFVPTRKHVRLTALDLLTSAAADGAQHRCVDTLGCCVGQVSS